MKDLLWTLLPLVYLAIFYGYTYFAVHYPNALHVNLIGNIGLSWAGILVLGCSFLAIVYIMNGISENRWIVLLAIVFVIYIVS